MTSPNPNDLLMGEGGKAAAFPTIGTTVSGFVVKPPDAKQVTDPDDGSLQFWPDGRPKMVVIASLQTELREDANDGVRSLWMKVPGNLQNTVKDAVRSTGAKGLEAGGFLTVTFTAEGEKKKAHHNPPKFYTATYRPPTSNPAADAALMGDPATNGQAHTTPATIPQQPVAAPAYAAPYQAPAVVAQAFPQAAPVAMAAAPKPLKLPAGMTPEVFNGLDEATRSLILANTPQY